MKNNPHLDPTKSNDCENVGKKAFAKNEGYHFKHKTCVSCISALTCAKYAKKDGDQTVVVAMKREFEQTHGMDFWGNDSWVTANSNNLFEMMKIFIRHSLRKGKKVSRNMVYEKIKYYAHTSVEQLIAEKGAEKASKLCKYLLRTNDTKIPELVLERIIEAKDGYTYNTDTEEFE